MPKKIDTAGLKHFKGKENAMIAGKPESTNTATVAHAVGEYFYWKGVLHIVTAAIAVGGTIQTNTNVKPAVLADDVGALKESFTELDELFNLYDLPKNRLDYAKMSTGYLLDASTGVASYTANANHNITGYCQCKPGEILNCACLNGNLTAYSYMGDNVRYAFYNGVYDFVSGGYTSGVNSTTPANLIVPNGAYYVRFGQLWNPTTASSRKAVVGNTEDYPDLASFLSDYETYSSAELEVYKFILPKNRLNYNDVTRGYLLDTSTGAVSHTSNNSHIASGYCRCVEGETLNIAVLSSNKESYTYCPSGTRYAFYDVTKTYISGGYTSNTSTTAMDIVVPTNAAFVRFGQFYYQPPSDLIITERRGVVGNTVDYPDRDSFLTNYDIFHEAEYGVPSTVITEETNIGNWNEKIWAAYGDSITAISNGDGLKLGWAAFVNDALEFGNFYGRGIGGQTFEWGTDGGSVAFINTSDGTYNSRNDSYTLDSYTGTVPDGCTAVRGAFCSWLRITTMFPASIKNSINMVFIMGGTNDTYSATEAEFVANDTTDTEWAASDYYSTYSGDYNISTFKGAVASTVMKIQAWMPHAVIVLGTPLNGRGTSGAIGTTLGGNDYQVASAIKELAVKLGCPCIDVYGTCGINPLNRTQYISDAVHPYMLTGKYMLARSVISGLRAICPIT